MKKENSNGSIIKQHAVPEGFPTHMHDAYFWECLGRAVATFGFLEETLAKAIFAFTATTKYSEKDIDNAYSKWLPKLERSLSDPLANLIDTYGKAVRDHSDVTIENFENLLTNLREGSKIRNVICHGSWRMPDQHGASIPFFVNKQKERFETSIDAPFLIQVQKNTGELICTVINTVTHMGWQFPGSNSPGKVIWDSAV